MSNPSNSDRRQGDDRRHPTARRRHAETRKVSVELCHSVLRVVIVVDNGDDKLPTLSARTVKWRHEAPNLLCDQGRNELATALRQIVTEHRLAGCNVSVAISSTLCVNRAVSGATGRVEEEISELTDRSQLYLALGPGPKTTAVGRKHIDARHEQALVTVANQQTLELLVEAAESAGLVVDTVESALVALSRLHGRLFDDDQSTVLLAQLDEERFEIGVARGDQLLLEYRPSSDTTVGRLGEVIDNHHERLRRFCQRRYGVGEADLNRMWLVGDPAEVKATNPRTRVPLEVGVLPLDRLDEIWAIENSDGLTAEMGAALGLALHGRSEGGAVSPNLMDELHARAKEPIRPFLLRAAAPIAAALLLAAGLWAYNLEHRVEVASLRAQVEAIKPDHLRGQRLSTELAESLLEIEQLNLLDQRMPRRAVGPLVQNIGHCLPDDVWLKGMRLVEMDQLTLSGTSYTEGGVYDLVRYLTDAPTFHDVALRGTGADQTPQGPATSFDIDILMTPAMLAPN